jgi:Fe-S-cluster containining protein
MSHPKVMPTDPIEQAFKLGEHWVPGIWRYMLPQAIADMTYPQERRATCLNCPRARFEGWRPDYRCCTYHPRVPNFLLGLALNHPASSRIVHQLVDDGFILPEGMVSSPSQWAFYLSDTAEERFGKSEKVLCPFLEKKSGMCNLYAFRNSVCSTFFCFHDNGDKGERFWGSLQTLAQQVEMALGQWALTQQGFDVEEMMKRINGLAAKVERTSDPQTGAWTPAARKVIWGRHYGREIELLQGCADLVRQNRDHLWKIANDIEILEPHRFDRAAVKVVPRKYRSEIDADYFETGDTAPPRDIWQSLVKLHRGLWKLPDGSLELSPRARIMTNPRDDETARAFGDCSHLVEFRARKNAREPEWKEFIHSGPATALAWFTRKRRVNEESLGHLATLMDQNPATFIAEWLGKKVLVRC